MLCLNLDLICRSSYRNCIRLTLVYFYLTATLSVKTESVPIFYLFYLFLFYPSASIIYTASVLLHYSFLNSYTNAICVFEFVIYGALKVSLTIN